MAGHQPVLLKEALTWLAVSGGGWWADLTIGGGGHTEALLQGTAPDGCVLGLDQDADALQAARERLAKYGSRVLLVQANFRELAQVAAEHAIPGFRGILMDLGVSSFQLDTAERGFSFQADGPLDMRMNQRQALTAAEILNQADEEELAQIFYLYGGERRSRQLARLVVRNRPLHTTSQLADLAMKAVGRHGRIHPATRAFQGLRIAVNDELASLEQGLQAAAGLLADGGRLVVISFHSLEDRIVKQFLRAGGWQILTRHVIRPEEEEQRMNPRSRSARLRAATRLPAAVQATAAAEAGQGLFPV